MAGHKRFREISKYKPDNPVRRARVAQYKAAMRTALALGDLRESRGVTQVVLASQLGLAQPNVSRIEHADDVYLSSLRNYLAALVGRMEVHAVFPDADVVVYADEPDPDE